MERERIVFVIITSIIALFIGVVGAESLIFTYIVISPSYTRYSHIFKRHYISPNLF